jgi:hypothetical protein
MWYDGSCTTSLHHQGDRTPLFLLLCGLLLVISTITMISMTPVIGSVDLPIVLLLLPCWPLVSCFKEVSSGLRCLNTDVSNCK